LVEPKVIWYYVNVEVVHRGRFGMASTTTVTSKGQITLPVEVRRQHGIEPGDRLVVQTVGGQIIVEPATASVDRLAGMLADLAVGRPLVTIEDMEEAAAAGWAREPIIER
jgi:AbrB family looped-hinge helix DNA binding protein